jgi:hypothetical protein
LKGSKYETSYLNFTATVKRMGLPIPWDLIAVGAVTAVVSPLIAYVIMTRRK